jgi:hypothetical protein
MTWGAARLSGSTGEIAMKQKTATPSLISDLTAVAGLYRNVFWMFRQQLKRGPDWQQELFDEAMRPPLPEKNREPELAGTRRN